MSVLSTLKARVKHDKATKDAAIADFRRLATELQTAISANDTAALNRIQAEISAAAEELATG